MIRSVTDLGDPALVLTLLLVAALVAALCGWWRGAVVWLLVTGGTLGLVLLLKIGFLTGWVASGSPVPGSVLLRSPSGHTACAALVYGGLVLLAGAPRPVWIGVTLLAAAGVGFTRVALLMHTATETAVGAAVGLCGVLLVARWAGPIPVVRGRAALLVAAALAIVTLHGRRLRIEDLLISFAQGLADGLTRIL